MWEILFLEIIPQKPQEIHKDEKEYVCHTHAKFFKQSPVFIHQKVFIWSKTVWV